MFLFGLSLHPGIRAALGIAVLVLGIVLHQVVLDALAAFFLILAAYQVYRVHRGGQGTRSPR